MDAQIDRPGKCHFWGALVLIGALSCSSATARAADSQSDSGEAQWIWAPLANKDKTPLGVCYFRKVFDASNPETASVQITCDDRYELYVNGRRVGTSNNWKVLQSYDIQRFLLNGRNVLAVKAENSAGPTAGLVARVTVKRHGGTDVSHSSDNTWKVTTTELSGWEKPRFNDSNWALARSFGEFGSAAPWGDQVTSADGSQTKRFSVVRDFRVERVLGPQNTGSLIAMAFNEWGEILASREKGPLLLIVDKNKDGVPETTTTYCEEVTSAQGILALSGDVYVTADGPEGAALYRLRDEDRDGKAEQVTKLIGFQQGMGEHGPHAVALGPDGLLYVMIGNHSSAKTTYDPRSPHRNYYEGDLPLPKYEDANGHAVGLKAPGGTVIRTDADGSFVELYAGGFRNAYDLAFNEQGDLFTYDSDMEWDIGLPWYRPTRINQVVAGAEFGWRSGWSPWPDYYIDNLPSTIDTGRGSPTGIEVYNHYMYPPPYHDAIFVGDWSQGRILAIHAEPSGAGYEAKSEVFLTGRPLNVTDMAVGPDGWLYFSTGGRGTEGGVYRVVWSGKVVPPNVGNPILKAARQPQPNSAWGRQRIAAIQEKLGDDWGPQLLALAEDSSAREADRTRAMDLMQLYGPMASGRKLVQLLHDKQPTVRAKAAFLLGIQPDKSAGPHLTKLTKDADSRVRLAACEAIARGRYAVDAATLVAAVGDTDRFVAWGARRALERLPVADWQTLVLESTSGRSFLVGSVALLTVQADKPTAEAVVERCRELMKGYLPDEDFIGLLRVLELAVVRGNLTGEDLPELRKQLAQEYPSSDWRMNRELMRLLAHMQESSILPRMLVELKGKSPEEEKIHAALMARFIKTGWTGQQKSAWLDFCEQIHSLEGGHSFIGYVDNVTRDFVATFTENERKQVILQAKLWPNGALAALATLPDKLSPEMVDKLIALDGEMKSVDSEGAKRFRTGIVAVLAATADEESMAHLRALFDAEPDRRDELSMGLAQSPGGANWPLLVRSLSSLDGMAAQEVLTQLATVDKEPEQPETLRQVIICGLKLGADGGPAAVALLEKWTGEKPSAKGDPIDKALAAWQSWFSKEFPELPPAVLASETEGGKWTAADLLGILTGPEATHGNAQRGAAVFEKAQCIKCHRFAGRGEGIGPDLSTVAQRFQKKEILESILFPSQVISDQYASKTITTTDGRAFTGIVGSLGPGTVVILQANGQKVTLKKDAIEETLPSKKSAMPDGLLNTLSQEEIIDLFAYLATRPAVNTVRAPRR